MRELKEAKHYAERRKIIFGKKRITKSLLQLGKSLSCIDRLQTSKIKDTTGATEVIGATGATGSFQQFQVSENTPNTTGSSAIPITSVVTTLKTITNYRGSNGK
ncbi:hypothetical protein L8C07_26160 [Paenibacillus sp. CMAA1739]|uniref:hypothetical protein n=1 Tax=Paenibacillus ottowii TaxID=2315729 RepID=UPI002DB7C5AE|nr:hypothetical protein [Paenibacillus sp. CMAA1739]MEC4569430.1 hypothetical protein [Paenibacillus sp. CMAA1739]